MKTFAKKTFSIVLTTLVLFSLFSAQVFAEEPVRVSFTSTSQNVYGGMEYTLTVRASDEVSSDIAVAISQNGEVYNATIKSGECEGSVSIISSAVSEKAELEYRIESGSGYSAGSNAVQSVNIYPVPSLFIAQDFAAAHPGATGSFAIEPSDRKPLPAALPLSLRLDDGTTLLEFTFNQDKNIRYVNFTAPDEYDARGQLHLYNEITGEEIDSLNLALINDDWNMISTVECSDKVAISFDCAYGSYNVDFVLDTLDKYDAKATFFMTGFFVRENPEAVKKIAERGHEIGNHSDSHPRLVKLNAEEIYKEISKCNEEIFEVTGGVRPTIFRPPYGACGATVYAVVQSCGMDVIRWSDDAFDYDLEYDIDKSIRCATENVEAGDIVIFHTSATHIRKTLDACLQDYIDKGLKIVNISELLIDGPSIITSDGRQIPDPAYDYISAKDILSASDFEIPADDGSSVALTPIFNDEPILRPIDDIEAVKNNPALLECTYDITSASLPVSAGEKVCNATFSYNGEIWFTAEMNAADTVFVNEDSESEVTPTDSAEPTDNEIAESANSSSCGAANSSGTIYSSPLIGALVLCIAVFIRKFAYRG